MVQDTVDEQTRKLIRCKRRTGNLKTQLVNVVKKFYDNPSSDKLAERTISLIKQYNTASKAFKRRQNNVNSFK